MAGIEAGKAGERTKEKADEAEMKVKEGVEKIEHSSAGKKLPTHIERIEFSDIVKIILVITGMLVVPLYIIVDEDMLSTRIHALRWVMLSIKYMVLAFGLVGVLIDAIIIFFKLGVLFKLILLLKSLKVISVVLSMIFVTTDTWFVKVLAMLYMIFIILVDLVFIYYSALYFARIESDEFDGQGNRKRDEENV
jgi:hypothetical protein